MKLIILLAGLLISGLATAAPNAVNVERGEFCNNHGTITQFLCGGYASGSGWYYDPADGCYYRDTGMSCYDNGNPPYNPPNPPYNPPNPPPNNGWTRIRCESWGNQYNECFLGYGVYRVTLERQYGMNNCIPYQTFGAQIDRMWVRGGCSGDFFVEYR